MTSNGQSAVCSRKDACFRAHCRNLNEDKPILSATKMLANDSGFWKYKALCGYSRGFLLAEAWNESKVVDDGNFWRFEWLRRYFFANVRDKASNMIRRYDDMLPPVGLWLITNEWPRMSGYFMSKSVFGQHFSTRSVWLSKMIAWKVKKIDP